MFYKLSAECLRNGKRVVRQLRDNNVDVCLSGCDENDDYVIVIRGTMDEAEQVRELVWEHNCGAYCDIAMLTEDEFNEMC